MIEKCAIPIVNVICCGAVLCPKCPTPLAVISSTAGYASLFILTVYFSHFDRLAQNDLGRTTTLLFWELAHVVLLVNCHLQNLLLLRLS